MNMKKTMASVMAGAMAVSAMATVVSADQDAISLTYDLKTYKEDKNKTAAKVTVVANYEGSLITDASWEVDDVYDSNGVLISGANTGYITFGAANGFVTAGDIYNERGTLIATIPEEFSADKHSDFGMTDFEFTARPYKDIVNDVEEKYQTYKATNDANNVDGAYYRTDLGGSDFDMPIAIGTNVGGTFDLTKYDMFTLGYSDGNDQSKASAAAIGIKPVAAAGEKYGVRDAVAKMTYKIPNVVSVNQANGWGWGADQFNWGGHNLNTDPYWISCVTPRVDEEAINKIALEYFGISTYGDATMSAEIFAKGFWTSTAGLKKLTIGGETALASEPTTVAVGAFTAGAAEEAVWPFKTTLKPSVRTDTNVSSYVKNTGNNENDVIEALTSRKAGGNYYTKPVAVLNDAIANHDNVTFTFKSYNGYVGTQKSHIVNQWVNVDQGYSYQTSSHDWFNPSFGQHLYTNIDDSYSLFDTDDYDMYGSYSSAWGMNLFTGAVVVNNGFTMQLSDTDVFTWGNNYLTFDWFDITDEGKITDAKTFLTSMLLYTPVDWYWDTLEVVVSDEEEEEIDAGEGLDGEGDVIADEEPVEDIVEETEPEVEETEAETEAAPVETAPNPSTGNAPVALAVIPVALAAAAVVAKKRG